MRFGLKNRRLASQPFSHATQNFSSDLPFIFRSLQKLEELEKEEELRETAGLYDSEPVSDLE